MRRNMTVASLVTAAALALTATAGGRDNRVTQDFHYTYDLAAGGRLDLTNTNGSVEISGWDRNSIDVSGTKYAPDQAGLDRIKVKVEAHGNSARVETELPHGDWFHGSYGVQYRIHVPRRILLDKLETTNGAISAENLEGGGRVNSTNGKLVLTHLSGDYQATTTNGSVEWEDCRGNQKSETTNGSVRGRITSGAIDASSTNGSIDLTLEQPVNGKPIHVSTTNGSVTLAMAQFHGNPIHAETTHGTVNLRLPEDTNAHLNAETSMASISNDLPMSSTEESSKHELRGKLGQGGPDISASSSMGSIHIQRY